MIWPHQTVDRGTQFVGQDRGCRIGGGDSCPARRWRSAGSRHFLRRISRRGFSCFPPRGPYMTLGLRSTSLGTVKRDGGGGEGPLSVMGSRLDSRAVKASVRVGQGACPGLQAWSPDVSSASQVGEHVWPEHRLRCGFSLWTTCLWFSPVLVGPEVAGLGLVSCPHNGQKPIGNSGQGSWRAPCCSEDMGGRFSSLAFLLWCFQDL